MLGLLVGSRIAGAAPKCPAAVEVLGSDPVAAEVRNMLRERKLSSATEPGCEAAEARVSGEPGEIVVELEDAYGRKTTRRVASALTAATLIESWVRTDVTEALLAPPASAGAPAPAPLVRTPPAGQQDDKSAAATLPNAPSLRGRGAVVIEPSVAFDGSPWLGGALTGCVMLGPVCTGGILRGMGDTRTAGESERLNSDRVSAEVLVSGSWPLRLGPVELAPGVGVGLGWTRIMSREPAPAPGDTVDVDSGSPRTELFLGLSLPLGNGVGLDGVLFAGWTPLAHTTPYSDDGRLLAGEARGRLGLGLGVSYGTP